MPPVIPVRVVVEPEREPLPAPTVEPLAVTPPSKAELEDKPEREPERVGKAKIGELVEEDEWLR